MDRTVFNKAQLEMLDIMAGIRSEEELEELKSSMLVVPMKNWINSGNRVSGTNRH